MKRVALFATLLLVVGAQVSFGASSAPHDKTVLPTADNAEVCLANCTSQSAACKRACPSTFSTPCTSNCDSQEQLCRQSCRPSR
jgi:hypothetical protein